MATAVNVMRSCNCKNDRHLVVFCNYINKSCLDKRIREEVLRILSRGYEVLAQLELRYPS
jgi:hypothetical protein